MASTDARCDRTAGNLDATAAPELEQAVVAQQAQRAQPGVLVHAYRCEVPRRGKSLAGQRFAVGDRPTDIGGDLLVQQGPTTKLASLAHVG